MRIEGGVGVASAKGETTGESSDAQAKALRDAASGIEAYFLRSLLQEMMASAGSMFGHDAAGSSVRAMFTETLAEAVAKSGGLGIGEQIVEGASGAIGAGGEIGPRNLKDAAINAMRPHAMTGRAASRALALSAYRASGVEGLSVAPVRGHLTDAFGPRSDPFSGELREHHGIDVGAPRGTPVMAAGRGIVKRAEETSGYGMMVVIDHGDGLETRYAHLDRIDVAVGSEVNAGASLGAVGSTGRSTGPHLHFEIRREGKPVDPLNVLPALKFSSGWSTR
ncbi:MAG: peptidoglycan DD-metalloendopeptidase family protein [Deltaproteobacteria bacterium]|nr:peptidoglycan DD-metalloendopeptidase family protein [Deltaproteobacteria bacterium]